MPAKRKVAAPTPAKTLEVQLWEAADKMRGAVPPTDYMHVCLGLVFLRSALGRGRKRGSHEAATT